MLSCAQIRHVWVNCARVHLCIGTGGYFFFLFEAGAMRRRLLIPPRPNQPDALVSRPYLGVRRGMKLQIFWWFEVGRHGN